MKKALLEFWQLCSLSAGRQQPVYLDPGSRSTIVSTTFSSADAGREDLTPGTTAPAIERLKVPVMNGWNQSLHGIVWTEPTTMFPCRSAWRRRGTRTLVHDVASAIADEGRAINNYWPTVTGRPSRPTDRDRTSRRPRTERLRHNGLVYRSPVINISRIRSGAG